MKQAAAMTLFPNVFHLFPLSLFLFSFMLILVLLVPSKDNLEALKQVRLVLKIPTDTNTLVHTSPANLSSRI